jgi:hypothetical protein
MSIPDELHMTFTWWQRLRDFQPYQLHQAMTHIFTSSITLPTDFSSPSITRTAFVAWTPPTRPRGKWNTHIQSRYRSRASDWQARRHHTPQLGLLDKHRQQQVSCDTNCHDDTCCDVFDGDIRCWNAWTGFSFHFRSQTDRPTNYGAEHCSRGHQLCSHSIVSQRSTEPESSLPQSRELSRPIQSTSPHPISSRSTLLLSTHLCLGLPSGLFPSGLPPTTYIPSSSPPLVLDDPPT